jgi:hypothetical protein
MKDLVMRFVNFFDRYVTPPNLKRQPFTFYLDARFSSPAVMKEIDQKGYKAVMSMFSTASPQPLWPFMKEGLQKREWILAAFDFSQGKEEGLRSPPFEQMDWKTDHCASQTQ